MVGIGVRGESRTKIWKEGDYNQQAWWESEGNDHKREMTPSELILISQNCFARDGASEPRLSEESWGN